MGYWILKRSVFPFVKWIRYTSSRTKDDVVSAIGYVAGDCDIQGPPQKVERRRQE